MSEPPRNEGNIRTKLVTSVLLSDRNASIGGFRRADGGSIGLDGERKSSDQPDGAKASNHRLRKREIFLSFGGGGATNSGTSRSTLLY